MEKQIYFSNEALARFIAAQNRKVVKVVCHLWVNRIQSEKTLEIVDNIELHFEDQQKLTISCNAEGDGLDAIDFDFHSSAKALEEEFEGKIKLFAVNASSTKMWSEVIGRVLRTVKLVKQNDFYRADSLILDFDGEKREIAIGPLDGLIIDYYEED